MGGRPDNWWVPNRGLFRASAYRQVGGIRPNSQGEYSADWTWLLHLALLGEFVRVPEALCEKYYKAASISKQWPHDPVQLAALREAGVGEVRLSPVGAVEKVLLMLRILAVPTPHPAGTYARVAALPLSEDRTAAIRHGAVRDVIRWGIGARAHEPLE